MSDALRLGGEKGTAPHRASPVSVAEPTHAPVTQSSALSALTTLLKHRYLLIGLPLLIAAAVGVRTVLRGPSYAAQSRFTPEAMQMGAGGRLAGIAADLGISIPRTGSQESIQFYEQLLRSPDLLRDVALTTYRVPAAGGRGGVRTGRLIDLLDARGSSEDRVRYTIGWLRERIATSVDVRANIVTLRTRAPSPELAVQLNRRMLELVSAFNLGKRKSRAAEERAFVAARLQEAERDLQAAEESLEQFLDRNRRYRESPQLTVQSQRLQRRVELRQQVYTSLAQAHEQARIDEIRNTPVITIVDQPEGSDHRTGRLAMTLLLVLVPAFALSAALAFAKEYFDRQREEHPEEYVQFQQARRAAVADLVPRPLRRRITSASNGSGDPVRE